MLCILSTTEHEIIDASPINHLERRTLQYPHLTRRGHTEHIYKNIWHSME
jgi:hypothetical protein